MKPRLAGGLSIRSVLLVGFGLTIGLWLLAGYQVTRRMSDAQRQAVAANARYVQAQELLSSVRTQVLVASVLVRDVLLDPNPDALSEHREEIERAYRSIDASLGRYVPFLGSPVERARVSRLRDEIHEFRSASGEALATDSSRWRTDARVLLRQFMPRREAAIRVSEELQSLNRSAFVDEQRTIREMQATTQRQARTVFGIALVISLAIGGLASRHATRLEQRLTEQRAREERISADLQRLSARLVQAQETEQARIARELHDEVGQALSAVKVELTVAQRRVGQLGGASDLLSAAQSSADTALRSIRDLSHLLHPSALDDLGLTAALGSQITEFQKRHGVAMDFVHEGVDRRHGAETERAVYRIVQEALTNIARHARATRGLVQLQSRRGILRVVVEDDGIGFDVPEAERPGGRHGLGLLGIRERVSQLQGMVRIESRPSGGGTRIEVEVPGREQSRIAEDAPADGMLGSSLVALEAETHHG